MKRLLQLATLLLLIATGTFAQSNGTLSDVAWRFNTGFPNYPVPGATITVCTYPATSPAIPCTNIAKIYGGPTTAVSMSNPFTADNNGNYSFWAAPGNYILTITGNNVLPYSKTVTVPCGAGFGCTTGAFNRLNSVGTQLKTTDFTFSGWGTGATITNASGTDTAFTVTITAGTTPSIVPTVTLTFHDGPWTSITTSQAQMTGGTGNVTDIETTNNLSTITLNYMGLPVATKTYTLTAILTGTSNLVPSGQIASLNPVVQNPTTSQTVSQPLGTTLGIGSLNNILTVDGVQYTTLQAAFTACPSTGCTIDMRGNSSATALNLGTFDPGSQAVTVLLGPFHYTVTQIITRSNLQIIGVGDDTTVITQASASIAPFILPPGGCTSGVAICTVAANVLFSGFDLEAAPSSTTDGFSMVGNLDAGGLGGGIWYSRWERIKVAASATNQFGRNAIRLETATENLTASLNGANQFLSFQDVTAFRGQNKPPTLMISGSYSGQISFNNCQFDGNSSANDTGANNYNIRIDDGGDNFVPYTISMMQVTSQWAGGTGSAAIYLGGITGFNCENCHFENDTGVVKEVVGTGGHGNWGISIKHGYMAGNVGRNSGNGYIADLGTQNGLDFSENGFFGTPDQTFLGTLTYLNVGPNWNASNGTMQPWMVLNFSSGSTFATLPSPATNGTFLYCRDCTIANPCAGSGTGAFAKRLNGVWVCN